MSSSNIFRFSIVIFFLLLATVNATFGNEVTAITKPSADVTLSYVQAGRISMINFREGDSIKLGDVLVQQDDSVERVRLEQLEAESKDKTQILASEAIHVAYSREALPGGGPYLGKRVADSRSFLGASGSIIRRTCARKRDSFAFVGAGSRKTI